MDRILHLANRSGELRKSLEEAQLRVIPTNPERWKWNVESGLWQPSFHCSVAGMTFSVEAEEAHWSGRVGGGMLSHSSGWGPDRYNWESLTKLLESMEEVLVQALRERRDNINRILEGVEPRG